MNQDGGRRAEAEGGGGESGKILLEMDEYHIFCANRSRRL